MTPINMKHFLTLGAIFAFVAVILGAFAAHALKTYLTDDMLRTFEIGVRYQFYHAIALIIVFVLSTIPVFEKSKALLNWAGICFIIGILLFSGSLYLLSCRELMSLPLAFIGPITPIGGTFFIVGWACIAAMSFEKKGIA
jgi:uncharacterized membrane protein YgdD (TMEM256/DUF423 family)